MPGTAADPAPELAVPSPGVDVPTELLVDFPGGAFAEAAASLTEHMLSSSFLDFLRSLRNAVARSKGQPSTARNQAKDDVDRAITELSRKLETALGDLARLEPASFGFYFVSDTPLLIHAADSLASFELATTLLPTPLSQTRPALIAEERRIRTIWVVVSRVCAATALVDGLAYADIWSRAYGTAGYRLSQGIPHLAGTILLSPAYAFLKGARNRNPWIDSYITVSGPSIGRAYDAFGRLKAMQVGPARWEMAGLGIGCPPDDQGETVPYPFPPIRPSLLRTPAAAAPAEHMNGRVRAQDRLERVLESWEHVRTRVLEAKGQLLSAVITAGSLPYGGAHPPHTTHRNGAMFDLDLAWLPDTRCEEEMQELVYPDELGEEIIADPPLVVGQSAAEVERLFADLFWQHEPLDLRVAPRPHPELERRPPKRRRKKRNPQVAERKGCAKDYAYLPPPVPIVDTSGNPIGLDAAGRLFVQCMLLSFPSQILYARWAVLGAAQRALVDRLDEIEEELSAEGGVKDSDIRALTYIRKRHLTDRAPAERPETKPRRWPTARPVLYLDFDHWNHWHLSYSPTEVEARDDEVAAALDWVRENLDRIWPPESH